MPCKHPARERLAHLILLLVVSLSFAQARAQSGAGATNSPTPGGAEKSLPGQGRLDQFESDLFGPNRRLDLRAPGTEIPLIKRPMVVQPDERTRQKLDAQKNWMFSGMHDLNTTPSLEQMLGMPEIGPDGREKPKMTAMEQYYDDLGKKNVPTSNSVGDAVTMLWTMKHLSGTNSLNPIVFAFPGGDQTLVKSLMTMPDLDHADAATAAGGNDSTEVSDSMAAAQAAASSDRMQKHYTESFKQLLGLGPSSPIAAPSSPGDSTSSLYSLTPPAVYNPAPAPSAAPLTPSSLGPVTGVFNPGTGAGGYHPFGAATAPPAFNAAGIPFTSPQTPPPQPAAPPISAMPVDPFTAYYPKHAH